MSSDFQEIEVNGEIVEFPAGMSDSEIEAAISGRGVPSGMTATRNSEGLPKPTLGRFFGAVGGLGETALQLGTGAIAAPVAGLAGLGSLLPGGMSGADRVSQVSNALTYQPRLATGDRITGAIAEPLEALDTAATNTLDTGNPGASTTLKTLLFGGPSALLLRSPVGAVRPKPSAPPKPIPTTAELFKSGSQAFDQARRLGGGIKSESVDRLANGVTSLKNESGLSVRINEALHPKAFHTQKEIMATLKRGDVTFDDLIELRQMAQDAAGSLDKSDAFRGRLLKNSLDDYVDSLGGGDVVGGNPTAAAASLKEARSNWHRASKAATIEEAIEVAGVNAGAFHGAGFENALRTQFRALSRRIVKGQERGFTPDEIALIKKTANGGTVDNIYRWIGKLAPTGVVSGGASLGGGFALGGPIGMAAVPAAGLLGRHLATKATTRNATNAAELARGGGLIPPNL